MQILKKIFFPELGVGMTTEGIEVKSVGNTLVLHETALIEAFNLKAAIEYQLKKCESKLRGKKIIIASRRIKNEVKSLNLILSLDESESHHMKLSYFKFRRILSSF